MKLKDEDKTKMFEEVSDAIKKAWLRVFKEDVNTTRDSFDDEIVVCVSKTDVFIAIDYSEDKVLYHPGYMQHYPGVRYYPDGSGEPPSEEPEYLIDGGILLLSKAIEETICKQVEMELDDLWMCEVEKKMDENEP